MGGKVVVGTQTCILPVLPGVGQMRVSDQDLTLPVMPRVT